MLTSQSQNSGRHGCPHMVTPSGWAQTPFDRDGRSSPSTVRWRSGADSTGMPR